MTASTLITMASRTPLMASVRTLTKTATPLHAWMWSNEAAKKSGHSSLLSDNPAVYELVEEAVKPSQWSEYNQRRSEKQIFYLSFEVSKSKSLPLEHLASWRFVHGDSRFNTVHLIKYPNGWSDVDTVRKSLYRDKDYLGSECVDLLDWQSNTFLKAFSFWPVPDLRPGSSIYDLRSYDVKPGSMYDWGNYWAKGIRCRTQVRKDIPYAGLFSQLGTLNRIYHIWAYADLADRRRCREDTWFEEEWNHVVANTVPLINVMKTRIVEPMHFSPTQ